MADLTDLLPFLLRDQSADTAIAASDPYAQVKQAPDLISQVLLQSAANPDYSLSDKITAGLLTGLGSGLLGGLSNDYQSRAKNAYTDILLHGGDKPDVLSQDVFDIANQQREKADIFSKLIGAEKESSNASNREAAEIKGLVDIASSSDSLDDREFAKQILAKKYQIDLGGAYPVATQGEVRGDVVDLGERRKQLQRETGSIKLGDALFEKEQTESKKELATLEDTTNALSVVGSVYDEAKKVKGVEAIPYVTAPFTEGGATLGGSQAVIMGFLQKLAKGNPSDKENAVLQQAMPKFYDSPERIEIKKKKMLSFLKLAAGGAPYLEAMERAGMDVDLGKLSAISGSKDNIVNTARSDQSSPTAGLQPPTGFQPTGRTSRGKPIYTDGSKFWIPD